MRLRKEILRLALPSILANITVPLVGMVDIAVVGHLGSTDSISGAAFIGGISVGSMLFDLLYWNFGFLRAGTGGLTAQAYGRERAAGGQAGHETADILSRALRLAFLSGIALIALQWVVVQAAFLVVDCSPQVRSLATRYFYIRIWGAPATLSLFALKGWFIGLQDTLRPMITDLWVNLVNILLSIGLGYGILLPSMGFSGVALGTLIAQWSGLALALLMARKYVRLSSLLKPNRENKAGRASFFTMNRDLFLRSVGMIAVYIGFTILSARLGDLMLAVSTILMKLLMIFSYFTDGFAYAGEALTGRFIGEHSREGVRATIRDTFLWSFGVVALFMLVYGAGGVPLFRLMTSDETVVQAGQAFIPWLLLMPLIGCPAFTWDGIYIGATASGDLRNSTLLCAAGFFAVWFVGKRLMDPMQPETALHLLMAAYFMHLAIRALYQSVRYKAAVIQPHFGA